MVRAATINGALQEGSVSAAPLNDVHQYNINVLNNGFLRDNGPGNLPIAYSKGDLTATSAGEKVSIDLNIGFNHFKRMLIEIAVAAEEHGRTEAEKAENHFGSVWNNPSVWKVYGVSARMEMTQDAHFKTRCGGSFQGFRLDRR